MADQENTGTATEAEVQTPVADVAAPTDVIAESSTAPTPDVNEDSSPSSVESKKTLLDVARDVLSHSRTEPAPAETQGSQPEDGQVTAEVPAEPTPTTDDGPEDFSDADNLPFGKHPRFKKLLSQANRDREPAKQFREVQTFLDEHGVNPVQAAEGLKAMALLQHARRGSVEHARLFLKDIDALRSEVRQLLGEDVPEDLREKIDQGIVDESTAKELAQARTRLKLTEVQQQEVQVERQQERAAEVANATKTAVAKWEEQVRTRDADYEKKAPLVVRAAKAIAAEKGSPRTPEEAVELVKVAYDEVNAHLKSMLPKPRPTIPTPRAPGGTPPARPQPKTLLDVVRLAAAQGRASA